jgi:hypothetical protein
MDSRFLAIENRLTALDSKLESKFDALASKFQASSMRWTKEVRVGFGILSRGSTDIYSV